MEERTPQLLRCHPHERASSSAEQELSRLEEGAIRDFWCGDGAR